ncbi:MAG: NAD-dependent epimerase/dehydratase family protein [Steroidobacteraceae bacterium]
MKGNTTVFIVGCGYVGRHLGVHCTQQFGSRLGKDFHLYGLVSSTQQLQALRAVRIEPIVLDLDKLIRKDLSPVWCRDSLLFYFAPPPTTGESDTRLHRFLNMLPAKPRAFIQISTTGVYGNTYGQQVDETSPVNPQTARAHRRMSAEHISRVWCMENQVRRVVLRVPAIYGPGRLPLARLHSDEPVICQEHSPIINRIHVDDLVQACCAAAINETISGVYNISDGNNTTMTDYLHLVAQLADLPNPREIPLDEAQLSFSPEYLSYLNESRRIDNSRLLRELGMQLKYADLKQGILASLQSRHKQSAK